jgi:hypothetical protein
VSLLSRILAGTRVLAATKCSYSTCGYNKIFVSYWLVCMAAMLRGDEKEVNVGVQEEWRCERKEGLLGEDQAHLEFN